MNQVNPDTWRDSSPDSIEADLSTLWREAGQTGPLSRALMSNLVVVSPSRSFPDVRDVARKHPARVILLSYTVGARSPCPPDSARVGLLTFGETTTRYGVELVAVHTVCADMSIPSIVRRLTRGDVPTSIWWTGDFCASAPPTALTALAQQVVYSSARWTDAKKGIAITASLRKQPHAPVFSDLNWRRLGPLRRAIVHALRADPGRDVGATGIKVRHRAGDAAAGWLMAGWMIARGRGAVEAGSVSVQEDPESGDGLSVTMGSGGWTLSASMAGCRVRGAVAGLPSFDLPVPGETEGDAVASELQHLAQDAGLADALTAFSTTQISV